jgi:Rrf2 family protein
MIDLAEHRSDTPIPLKDIVVRQEISQKYLESIMTDLSKAGVVSAQHGKGGGYRLNRDPDQITVLEILLTAEGDLAPISCLDQAAEPCARAAECRTLPMWEKLYSLMRDYLSGITLADLMASGTDPGGDNYVI